MRKLPKTTSRLLKSFVILGAVFSVGASCLRVKPPHQVLCLIDLSGLVPGAQCIDTETTTDPVFLPLVKMDGYVARSPDDEQILETWVKNMIVNCSGAKGQTLQEIQSIPLPVERLLGHVRY